MKFSEFFQSAKYKWLLWALGGLIVLLLVFQLGVYVGFRKANYAFRWGENYHRVFGGPKRGFFQEFEGRDFTNGHGAAGSIVSVNGEKLVVKGRDNVEKIINTDANTLVVKGRETLAVGDLKVDNAVVVIGTPNEDGSISAKIIRVFDAGERPVFPPPAPMTPFR